ncbi:protein AF1q isoform X2 [Onychostruthus taczanowskii]|uniref:protein AF1q isoform X2 n=1 Tax=Onychostruthus taczanowskii TaxID=356909 RepID=UPI001B80A40B|nr:protein AF1q isoform X2 [Onychostruthus taczanowskii]
MLISGRGGQGLPSASQLKASGVNQLQYILSLGVQRAGSPPAPPPLPPSPPSPARVGAADSSAIITIITITILPAGGRAVGGAALQSRQTKATLLRPRLPGTKSPARSELTAPGTARSLKMLDTISSQYDSFIYWRMPIPRLDMAELEGLGLADMALYKPKGGLGKLSDHRGSQELSQEEEEEVSLLQFNSFNFWRAPIASISSLDFDLI